MKNQNLQLDLVKMFYDQEIDHKTLEIALDQRQKTAKQITNLSLAPYQGDFDESAQKHLLNRVLVGYSKKHLDDISGLSLSESLDLIFTAEELQEPVNLYYWKMNASQYQERYESEDVGPNEPFINRTYRPLRPTFEEQFGQERNRSVKSILYDGMYRQQTSIHWKLFLFLHNLVPTRAFDTIGHKGGYNYIKLLFDSCFGNYKDFIYNITLDGSMLIFLNLALSQKDTPDENYAREVQELFTVGKRPFAQFTEDDVREIARALVGWNYDYDSIVYKAGHENIPMFQEWNHDTGDKFFSSFYNNKVIRGKEGPEGAEELQEVIDMLFETDESAIYIARRLYQFFVYPVTTAEIEEQIIKPLSVLFKDNNYSLIVPLKVLLQSEHFYDVHLRHSQIKSPIEFLNGIFKSLDFLSGFPQYWDGSNEWLGNFEPDFFTDQEKDLSWYKYRYTNEMSWRSSNMGMDILNPPSVSGWPAYYQEPVYDLFWINSSTIKARNDIQGVIKWGMWLNIERDPNQYTNLRYDFHAFLNSFSNPKNISLFIDELLARFVTLSVPTITKTRIRNALINDIDAMHWEELATKILDQNAEPWEYNNLHYRVSDAIASIIILGEFQLQ